MSSLLALFYRKSEDAMDTGATIASKQDTMENMPPPTIHQDSMDIKAPPKTKRDSSDSKGPARTKRDSSECTKSALRTRRESMVDRPTVKIKRDSADYRASARPKFIMDAKGNLKTTHWTVDPKGKLRTAQTGMESKKDTRSRQNLLGSRKVSRTKQIERYTKSLKVKRLLVFLNLLSIVLSPIAYIPLSKIQVAYVNKCFLNTEIQVDDDRSENITEHHHHHYFYFRFSSERSIWGSETTCNYATYGLVGIQIISIITFWIIIHLWGEMMSIGNGGAMAVVLSIIYITTTVNCYLFYSAYTEGFRVFCKSISKIETDYNRLSCQTWKNEIKFEEVDAMDVIHYMYLAQSIQLSLMVVEAVKVLNCLSVAFVTHHRYPATP